MKRPKRTTDLMITVAGDDPKLTDFFATEVASYLSKLAVADVTSTTDSGFNGEAENSPATAGVERLRTLLAIAKRGTTILVTEGE